MCPKKNFINDAQERILKNSQSNPYMLTSGKIFPIILKTSQISPSHTY